MKSNFKKVLSIVLSVCMLLSVCFVAGMVSVSADMGVTRDYYVRYDGVAYNSSDSYGTNGTLTNPYKTVMDAVKAVSADSAFDIDGNTANIHIMQNVTELVSESQDKSNVVAFREHNNDERAELPEHNATAVIKAYSGNTYNATVDCTYVVNTSCLGKDSAVILGGPTVIEDICILYTNSGNLSNWNTPLIANGNDLTISETTQFAYAVNMNSGSNWNNLNLSTVISKIDMLPIYAANWMTGSKTYTKPSKITINSADGFSALNDATCGYIAVCDGNEGVPASKYKEDLTIELKLGRNYSNPRVRIGSSWNAGKTPGAVFEKNLNFKIISGDYFGFNTDQKITVDGAVQVIYSNQANLFNPEYSATDVGNNAFTTNGTPADVWALKVEEASINSVDFIEGTKGKFQIADGFAATATPKEGGNPISSEDGVLDLAAAPGEYIVTLAAQSLSSVYVQAGATGTGLSAKSPIGSVSEAITLINNAGMTEENTINVFIMQDIAAVEKVGDRNHNLAYWGNPVEHTAKIIVRPYAENQKVNTDITDTYLAIGDQVGGWKELILGGPTEFRNLKIVYTTSSLYENYYSVIIPNGNNLTFGDGISYAYINANGNTFGSWNGELIDIGNLTTAIGSHGSGEFNKPIKLTFNSGFGRHGNTICVPAVGDEAANTYKFNEDVTLEFNSKDFYGTYIQIGATSEGVTTTFEKNLIFKVLHNGGILSFKQGNGNIVVKGGVHFINNASAIYEWDQTDFSFSKITNFVDGEGNPADIWYLNVPNEQVSLVSYYGETGKFKVSAGTEVTATNADDPSIVVNADENGIIDLSANPGVYNIEIVVPIVKTYDYFVKAGGTGDGLSFDAPAPSVSAAIKSIKEKGNIEPDEPVNIFIMQSITAIEGEKDKTHNMAYWGEYVEYTNPITIKSYSGNSYNAAVNKTLIAFNKELASQDELKLGGKTTFTDVELVYTSSSNTETKRVNFNGNEVVIGKDTTFGFMNLNGLAFNSFQNDPGDITEYWKTVSIITAALSDDATAKSYEDVINVTFERGFDGVQQYDTGKNHSFVVGDGAATYKKDVNLIFNFNNTYGGRVFLAKDGGATFEKNLNIKLKDADQFAFRTDGDVTVKGGLQLIYSTNTTFNDENGYQYVGDRVYKEGSTLADTWTVAVDKSYFGDVNFIEGTKGKFQISSGAVVLATSLDNPSITFEGKNGLLDLSSAPGNYKVEFTSFKRMLKIDSTKYGPLFQRIDTLVPGATYTIKFSLSNNISGFDVGVWNASMRTDRLWDAETTFVKATDKGRYSEYEYTIKLPEDLNDGEENRAWIGIIFGRRSKTYGYAFDFSLYKNDDVNKTNLYKNPDYLNGCDYWGYEWEIRGLSDVADGSTKVECVTGGEVTTTLEVVGFDEAVMDDVKANLPDYGPKMIYFKNGPTLNIFSQLIGCTPGQKFILNYSVYSTEDLVPQLNKNGLRERLDGKLEILSETKYDNYTNYKVRLTVPEDYDDTSIFLGLEIPYYAEGYFFDFYAYEDGDETEKKNIFAENPNFVNGFDGWIFGWTVTWFGKEDALTNIKEYIDENHILRVSSKDLSKVDELIASMNIDDGEWWNPKDVEPLVDTTNVATVNGIFKDQNGAAVSGVKLLLKSEDNSYTVTTAADGSFSFNNIVAGYYDLLFVDSNGKEIETGFYCNLSKGDVVTLNIGTDTTKEEEPKAVGSLKGTVYTPELKTVANIKLYLRGVAETVTDAEGNFSFGEVEAGSYDLYTVLEDGSEYLFRTVEIKENVDLAVKLKYDINSSEPVIDNNDVEDEGSINWLWIVIAIAAVVIIVAGVIVVIVLKKKKV